MYKLPMTYVDFDGNTRNEDFYFHLSKTELVEMQASVMGGMEQHLRKIVNEQDKKRLIELFKDLIYRSYGEKSLDGKHFVKSKEISDAFTYTNAYSDLFIKLVSDTEFAIEFVNAVIPADLKDQL